MTQHIIYRQGDILIERVRRSTRKLAPVAAEHGRLILARGEVTGHHHSVATEAAALSLDEGGVMFLTVEELTEVVHQEHAPIQLEPGTYRVLRQREYSPQEIRSVAD
jgi:hypothetical protein